MADETLKNCNKCRVNKPLQDFPVRKVPKFSIRGICKKCVAEVSSSEKMLSRRRQVYRARMRDEPAYRSSKKEFTRKYRARLRSNPIEYAKFLEKNLAKNKEWRKTPRAKEVLRELNRKRLKSVQYRIRLRVSSRILAKLKSRGESKRGKSSWSILPYSVDELREHLESKFLAGMAWSNYGKAWHIDHIIPDSWFKYTSMDDSDFLKSWSLTNLEPKWAIDNLRKGNRYIG